MLLHSVGSSAFQHRNTLYLTRTSSLYEPILLALLLPSLLGACSDSGSTTDTSATDQTSGTNTTDTSNTTAGTETTSTVGADNLASATDGVLCDYMDSTYNASPSIDATSTSDWTCDGTNRVLTANGLPDHEVVTFPNAANPNTITEQNVSASYSLMPLETENATQLGGPAGTIA
jgi:hypothetical protein